MKGIDSQATPVRRPLPQQLFTSGQLVGLAVTGKNRLKNAPNLPTFRELGLPQQEAGTFQGILTTAGSPPEIVARLSEELRKILKTKSW